MDTKIINCPACSKSLRIPEDKNIKFKCPYCGRTYFRMNGKLESEKQKLQRLKRRKTLAYTLLCILVVAIGYVSFAIISKPQKIESTLAYASKDSVWTDFREKYPYQFQVVGLAAYEDNSKLLLISEPPTHVTIGKVHEILEGYNYHGSIVEHRVGYDGWAKDILICLNGLSAKKYEKLISRLQTYLYHTDYKAYTVNLDSLKPEKYFLEDNLNYLVSSDELYNWFMRDGEKLKKINAEGQFDSEIKTLSDFLYPIDLDGNIFSPDGIYYSDVPGFVVWILPENFDINTESKKNDARRFALDSDLILGAISNGDYVAVIGREREISVLELPPLRVETILLLAENSDKETLAQSFEYNRWFLGKQKGGKDWYFAWLCPELINTEYGNLLNWTDHVLKSWTDANSLGCEYIDFPDPLEYPFDGPLSTKILKCQSLIYNWSSQNLTYTFDYNNYNVQACLGGTGCLPITYIPAWNNRGDSIPVGKYKEIGYDYFSNLNNPSIARVVQYQTLYQIFQNAKVYADSQSADTSHIMDVLYSNSLQIIKRLSSLTDKDKELIIQGCFRQERDKKYWKDNERAYRELKSRNPAPTFSDIPLSYDNYKKYWESCITENLDYLQNYFSGLDEKAINFYGKSLSLSERSLEELEMIDDLLKSENLELKGEKGHLGYSAYKNIGEDSDKPILEYEDWVASEFKKEQDKYDEYLKTEKRKMSDLIEFYSDKLGFDKTKMKDEFVGSQNHDIDSWVKTPLIVETWNQLDSAFWTGGHNLYSRPVKFEAESTVPEGTLLKEGGNIIGFASSEKGDIRKILSHHIRQGEIGIQNVYADELFSIARRRAEVIPPHTLRTKRGFNVADHLLIRQESDYIKIGNEKIQNHSGIVDYLVKNELSGVMTFENVTINRVKAIMTNADIKQTALLKGGKNATMSKEFAQLDFSKWMYAKVGDIIEVKIPRIDSSTGKSCAKMSFKERFFEYVKSIYRKIKGSKDPWLKFRKELKEFDIPENEIKVQMQYEIQNGVIVDNLIKPDKYGNRTGISTDAA